MYLDRIALYDRQYDQTFNVHFGRRVDLRALFASGDVGVGERFADHFFARNVSFYHRLQRHIDERHKPVVELHQRSTLAEHNYHLAEVAAEWIRVVRLSKGQPLCVTRFVGVNQGYGCGVETKQVTPTVHESLDRLAKRERLVARVRLVIENLDRVRNAEQR